MEALRIRILPNDIEFPQMGSENVLQSALNAGISVNYGCSAGNCGLCKAKLLSGQVEKTRFYDYVLPEAEKNQGFFLMCAHRAISDLTVEVPLAHQAADIAPQTIRTRIKKIAELQQDVRLLQLQTPRTQTLRFLAGQTVTLQHGEHSMELAIASCPCDERNLQFHIVRNDNAFSQAVFSSLKPNDSVQLHGPHGEFTLESYCERPSVFIAYETGFAPVRSLIEHSMSLGMECSIELHLMHSREKHYAHNLCRSWKDALDHFRYLDYRTEQPLPPAEIAQSVLQNHPDLNNVHVYVAGPETVTQAFAATIAAAGLPGDNVKYFQTDFAA